MRRARSPRRLATDRARAGTDAAAAALDAKALANIRELDDDGEGVDPGRGHRHLPRRDAAPPGAPAAAPSTPRTPAELARVAHAFKSASSNVGASQLGKLCRELERTAAAANWREALPTAVARSSSRSKRCARCCKAEMGPPHEHRPTSHPGRRRRRRRPPPDARHADARRLRSQRSRRRRRRRSKRCASCCPTWC